MLIFTLHDRKRCLPFVVLVVCILLVGCAAQNKVPRVQLNNDGTMLDAKTGLMWQIVRSKQVVTSGPDAQAYAAQLQLAGYDDWRLPTSRELWELYFANDYSMCGELAKKVKLDRSYWTKDGDKILAGYLEDSDDPGINRVFLDSNKGFVRAVRSTR